jgi:DNA-binding transcriptional LysR family regulator
MAQPTPQLDLNLLRVFAAVLQDGSLTAAGERLGITQSAVSHALARLRTQVGDPLFVRSTRGMLPTAYAQQLADSVLQGLGLIDRGLGLQAQFDPRTSARGFRILTTDIAEMQFFPALMEHLLRVAPGISVRSTPTDRARYREALESGAADLAIGRLPPAQRDFHQQHLFDVPLVCMLRRAHPGIGERITLKSFLASPQISVSEPAQVEGLVRRALGRRAAQRRIALDVTHYVVVPMILARTDLIAVMPLIGGTDMLEQYDLKAIPLPFKLPAFQVVQFWHERVHLDPGHQWLRRTIAELFSPRRTG